MRYFLVNLLLIIVMLCITSFTVVYELEHAIHLSFFVDPQLRFAVLWRPLFLGLLMLVGIVFGYVHSHLNAEPKTRKINILTEFKTAFTHAALWRSLLCAPLIYSVVYLLAE